MRDHHASGDIRRKNAWKPGFVIMLSYGDTVNQYTSQDEASQQRSQDCCVSCRPAISSVTVLFGMSTYC